MAFFNKLPLSVRSNGRREMQRGPFEEFDPSGADVESFSLFSGPEIVPGPQQQLWQTVEATNIPRCSMVLEYLPTKLVDFGVNVGKYSSTMEHMGIYMLRYVENSKCEKHLS